MLLIGSHCCIGPGLCPSRVALKPSHGAQSVAAVLPHAYQTTVLGACCGSIASRNQGGQFAAPYRRGMLRDLFFREVPSPP